MQPVGGLLISIILNKIARVAELVDALDLGSSGATRESSSLSFRTNMSIFFKRLCLSH